MTRHKIAGIVRLQLDGRTLVETADPQAQQRALDLAGCYVIASDVASDKLTAQRIHESYTALQKVERDFRTMKTGLLEVLSVFVRKESRTRGHLFCCVLALKLQRETERWLAAAFGPTDKDPNTTTVPDALAALGRLSLNIYDIDGKTSVTQLPQPDAHQRRILEELKIPLPVK